MSQRGFGGGVNELVHAQYLEISLVCFASLKTKTKTKTQLLHSYHHQHYYYVKSHGTYDDIGFFSMDLANPLYNLTHDYVAKPLSRNSLPVSIP